VIALLAPRAAKIFIRGAMKLQSTRGDAREV
jgi:hypothetical protein